MFGFISKQKYVQLLNENKENVKELGELTSKLDKSKLDCYSLRKQNSVLREENSKLEEENTLLTEKNKSLKNDNNKLRQFKRDTLEALANIDFGSFRPIVCKSKCETCENEPTDCKKYQFGNHTFCLVRK